MRYKLLIFFICLGFSSSLFAHKSNMGVFQISHDTDKPDHSYTINWSFSGLPMREFPTPRLPDDCKQTTVKRLNNQSSGVSEHYAVICENSLVGQPLLFNGEYKNINQLILHYSVGDINVEKVFTNDNFLPIVNKEDMASSSVGNQTSMITKDFFVIGIKHMILGWDHLLFLICLVFLTGFSRKLVLAITGFTVGHMLTLMLSSWNVVILPSTPVEALIALSIVYMAAEILHIKAGQTSIFSRYPLVISVSFGLLHGLGFASSLKELTLNADLSFIALLVFNLGVEVAQLMVVCLLAILLYGVRAQTPKLISQYGDLGTKTLSYAIGMISAYWFVERIALF